jgi:hypothetical protein
MPLIIIIIKPAETAGSFAAYACGMQLCSSSRTPLCDAARALLLAGLDPVTVLIMRHRGSAVDALRARLGAAAQFTIGDDRFGRPKIRRWKPPSGDVAAPPIAPNENSDLAIVEAAS